MFKLDKDGCQGSLYNKHIVWSFAKQEEYIKVGRTWTLRSHPKRNRLKSWAGLRDFKILRNWDFAQPFRTKTAVTYKFFRQHAASIYGFVRLFISFRLFVHFVRSFRSFVSFVRFVRSFHSFCSFVLFVRFVRSFLSFVDLAENVRLEGPKKSGNSLL